MSKNPFSEPEDADRTILRPVPGGRPRTEPAAAPSAPPPERAAPPLAERVESVAMGGNPLVAAAAPLLQLLARLRNTLNQPDPADLRERAVQAMRAFEEETRARGLPLELIRPAHYALCAALDDVVLNTPWGSTGIWNARSLVSTFHQEVRSGERFFELLAQMRQNPGKFLPVVDLMYLCIALGFQGRYRLSPRGPAELDRLREETYALIVRQRPSAEPSLSPHWRGVAAPYRATRARIPVWVVASVALAVLALLFVWFSLRLGAASDKVFAQVLRVPPTHMPQLVRPRRVPPPPPPPPSRGCSALKNELKGYPVTVICNPTAPLVRIPSGGMFASGSAVVEPRFVPLLQSIGQALKKEKGKIEIIGYTDNQPIHTILFPSNFELSLARAKAARAIVARMLGDPARVVAEGRGETDPLCPANNTPQCRAENRRIEIVLHQPG